MSAKDEQFKALVAQHNELNNRIRILEEKQQPISNEEIETMRFERTALKDRTYSGLKKAWLSVLGAACCSIYCDRT
ncbi:MAG: DUF465 domain-containing protein [Opitutales bacterium]|nr:DUF465 domain-containing protein [Opitutales bacterium]